MSDILHLEFETLARPVALIDCRHLVEYFPLIFPGWQITELENSNLSPIITLYQSDSSTYFLETEWTDKKQAYKDKVDAICALVAKVVKAGTMDDLDMLCLHGAAAEIGSALVIFPAGYRAGKSLLTVCLAASGIKVFADDVIPVKLSDGLGIAPGLAPRLRLPYPENLSTQTTRFIRSRVALEGSRYQYLDFRDGPLATRHSRSPIGAFVVLEREQGAKPALEPISEAEVLRRVVWQNFAREADAPSILRRLGQIVNAAQRFRMRYDRAEDAVTLLKSSFHDLTGDGIVFSQQSSLENNSRNKTSELIKGQVLRKSGISEVAMDGEVFLADARGATIHHLNPVGYAIWSLLAEPITQRQIIDLISAAFPDADRNQVEADVSKLIKTLKFKKLLISGSK